MPTLTEDQIDDLLYHARTGDVEALGSEVEALRQSLDCSAVEVVEAAVDEGSGNGVAHFAAGNGHLCEFLPMLVVSECADHVQPCSRS